METELNMTETKPELKLYEKLLMIFPGYRGYKEKELIRETDKIVREQLYRRLKNIINILRDIQVDLSSRNKITDALEIERLVYSIDTIATRTKHAPHGYKPLFYVVKVDEKDLSKLLEHDLSLSEIIDKLVKATETLREKTTRGEDIKASIREIQEITRQYESKLAERDNIITSTGVRQ
ncbi:MAG: hypothetical protein QXY82_04665 [Desulfurococcaceae archaeon]